MESSYLKEEQNKVSYPPSPKSAPVFLNHKQKPEKAMTKATTAKTKVTLEIEVDAQDWFTFQSLVMINPEAKKLFLEHSIQFRLKELLYENPDLFSHYARPHA